MEISELLSDNIADSHLMQSVLTNKPVIQRTNPGLLSDFEIEKELDKLAALCDYDIQDYMPTKSDSISIVLQRPSVKQTAI